MSQTTPPTPRHARADELRDETEPPTTAIPVQVPEQVAGRPVADVPVIANEFTDDTTQAIPVIPVQRATPAVRPGRSSSPGALPAAPGRRRPADAPRLPPAGLHPVTTVPPAPRRRVLPAVLAGVTACLLVAGVVVGVTGATVTDLTGEPPATSGTP